MDDKKIGARLEALRTLHGETQVKFCDKINVMQANYASIVSGKRSITTKMIFGIQEHFGTMVVTKILFGDDESDAQEKMNHYMCGDPFQLSDDDGFIYRRDTSTVRKMGYVSLYARNRDTSESFNFKEVLTKCADGSACVVLERYIHGLRFAHTLNFNEFKFIENPTNP